MISIGQKKYWQIYSSWSYSRVHYLLAKQEVRELLLLWFTLRVQITLSHGGAVFVWTAASVFCTTTIAPRRRKNDWIQKIVLCKVLEFYLVWLIPFMFWNPRPFIFPGVSLNPNPQMWPLNKSLFISEWKKFFVRFDEYVVILKFMIRVSQKNQKSEFCFATNPTGFHRLDEPPEKISAL